MLAVSVPRFLRALGVCFLYVWGSFLQTLLFDTILCLRNVCGVSVCVGHNGQASSLGCSLFVLDLSFPQLFVFGIFGSNAISQMECFPNLLDLLRIKSVWERGHRKSRGLYEPFV